MLRYTQADASLLRDCWDMRLWYHCQKEIQDSRNSSALLSYNPKRAQSLQLHQELYRECATAGGCLSLPKWNRQQKGQELVTVSQNQDFCFFSVNDIRMQITTEMN